ncbi:MAG: AtuA-related protein [Bryobacteraceae bacterium]
MKIRLSHVAHARSGDKGDISNIGLIATEPRYYLILLREVTAERVKQHFGALVCGSVTRYELPNLSALNFVMEKALDGGGTLSLRTDAQGKTHGAALLMMQIEVASDELAR